MATISVNTYTAETFKTNLLTITRGIVWKNTTSAKEKETVENVYLADLFIAANRGILTFDVIRQFPQEILEACGITGDDVYIYSSDKTKIPEENRDLIVSTYQEALKSVNPYTGHLGYPLTSYENQMILNPDTNQYEMRRVKVTNYVTFFDDQNNYYRMLNGLPDVEDTDFIYNTDEHWDTKTPIHLMNIIDRVEMESAGVLQKYIDANPDKPYLKYLGKKQINIYEARVAERFAILWLNGSSTNKLVADFLDIYEGAKNQVNAVYYTDAYRKTNDLYENFLAMCVLFMSIQTMAHRYLGVDVTRDFYDTDSIKYVYDSYSVPFYNEIPLEYHRRIIKAINRLIGYKGSDKVFYDLFGIFDMGSMEIYSYYLTKSHRFGENGNPILTPKTDEEGNPIVDSEGNTVIDPSAYSVQFARAGVYEDPALAVANPENFVDKSELSDLDPYWVEDPNLIKKLEDESFNFTESKYIGVQTILDLLKIAYENAWLFKMITDNKEITDALTFVWPEENLVVSIYDCIIYTACIYCKLYHMEGYISSALPSIGAVLGYDFKEDLAAVQEYLVNNDWTQRLDLYLNANDAAAKKHDDSELVAKLLDMDITDMASLSRVFDNMYEIEAFLRNRYMDAKDLEEYFVYKRLYDTLMTSKHVQEGLMKYRDPTAIYYLNTNSEQLYQTYADRAPVILDEDDATAESFFTLLSDTCPQLANRLAVLTDVELESELQIIVDKIQELIDTVQYLPFSVGLDTSNMLDSLLKILRFFKSAKAELAGYNIIFAITARGLNYMKFFDRIKQWNFSTKGEENHYFTDYVKNFHYHEKMVGDETSIVKVDRLRERFILTMRRDYIQHLQDKVVEQSFAHGTKPIGELNFSDETRDLKFTTGYRTNCFMTDRLRSADGRPL